MRTSKILVLPVSAVLVCAIPAWVHSAPAPESPPGAGSSSGAGAGSSSGAGAGSRSAPVPQATDRGATSRAREAGATVAVTSVSTLAIDPAARAGFEKSFAGGLAAGGLRVMDLAAVRAALQAHSGLVGCETAVCLRQIGVLLRAPLCGRATVEKVGSATFRIDVVLTSARTAASVAHVEQQCDLCNLREAREALSRAAADAARKVAAKPGPRLLHARQQGAGRPAGQGARKAARRPAAPRRASPRRETAAAQQPSPSARQVDRGRPLRAWGYATLGLGVAAVIPGAVLLAIHGKDTGEGPPDSDRYRWNTRAGGATLLGVGAAALAAGTTLVVVGLLRRSTQVPVVTVSWDPRRRSALVSGFFRF